MFLGSASGVGMHGAGRSRWIVDAALQRDVDEMPFNVSSIDDIPDGLGVEILNRQGVIIAPAYIDAVGVLTSRGAI